MISRIRTVIANQAGAVMISSLIGSLVSMVLLGVIGSGITMLLMTQGKAGLANDTAGQIVLTDTALRSDIRFASAVTATAENSVAMTVPGESGKCRTVVWSPAKTEGKTQLVRTATSYPSYDTTTNPVQCSGVPAAPESTVMVKSLAPDTAFGYANAGGRELTTAAGALVPAEDGPTPASVPVEKWESSALASVSVSTTVGHGTPSPKDLRIHQVASSLNSETGAADMATHHVPDKNLRTAAE